MRFTDRLYPTFVRVLGGVGLGTAVAYFIGVGLVFRSGWEEWAQFFSVWGPPLAFVPGAALIAYLYLRTHLGRWFVERERYGEAVAYTEERLDPGWMRSRKETIYHRIYLARARVGERDYEGAIRALTDGYAVPEEGREAALIRRWQLEAALRLERGAAVEEAYEAGIEANPSSVCRAALHGGRAEWAVLEGSSEAYHTHVEKGRASEEHHPRVDLARGFGSVRFGRDEEPLEEGLRALERCREEAAREVPGRAAEIEAVRSQLLARLGDDEQARAVLEEVDRDAADARSRRRLEHVASLLEEEEIERVSRD